MRIRRDRMLQFNVQRQYRAIEAENARAAMEAQSQRAAPAPEVERNDTRTVEEIALAAQRALRGAL